jgi:hypothetical protein
MRPHAFRFWVLSRTGSPEQASRLPVDEQGRTATDLGRKDTVLVWPGETVRIAMDFFHGFEGEQLYHFHCHILERVDSGTEVQRKGGQAPNGGPGGALRDLAQERPSSEPHGHRGDGPSRGRCLLGRLDSGPESHLRAGAKQIFSPAPHGPLIQAVRH